MSSNTQRALRSVENEPESDKMCRPAQRLKAVDNFNESVRKTTARTIRRSRRAKLQNEPVKGKEIIDNESARNIKAGAHRSPVTKSLSAFDRIDNRGSRSVSPELPSLEFALTDVSNFELPIELGESAPSVDVRSDKDEVLFERTSFDAEQSVASSSSRAFRRISGIDFIIPDITSTNNTLLPHAYSTFFETSTLDNNHACNLLKPKFIEATNFFPGDDIDKDVPWIGKISRTYSRKRCQNSASAQLLFQDFGSSSYSEGDDLRGLETQRITKRTSTKINSKLKRKRLLHLPPGFNEWANRMNAEFREVDKHELSVEDYPKHT